ncbi:MAG: protease regulatory subunit [Amycolatopsis sp.]|uniref:ATP-binding protein n=1 Tax=Amycolatopsis sp. TaxID=37632 RepID=UPI0026355D1A|nr:AAA family ATPase [Amycolatopsis sp.]MCU1681722.1 protease regulatory subunit [Amycolatopsis sp.]
MTVDVNYPQRVIARVKSLNKEEKIIYLEIPNGNIITIPSDTEEEFRVDDVVLVGPQWTDVESAPKDLWPGNKWIGTVKVTLDDVVILSISGALRTIPIPSHLPVKIGSTVEGNDVEGITRVLTNKPIPFLDVSIGDAFDIDQLRENPDRSLSYDDFGGYPQIKARTKELIELPLQKHEALRKIGAKAIKGVLFTGPSGTGKTLLGRIIAHQAAADFYKISGPEIISKYVGQSEEIIRAIFDDARKQERAIIFFDEIDSVAPQRSEESHEASRRLVAQLLTLMDGFNQDDNIIVIATTNRPQDVDVALRRPGRFDWEIRFDNPSRDDRESILATSARNLNIADNVSHSNVADVTAGWSSADLTAIWSEAALLAVGDGRDIIVMEDYFGGYQRVAEQRLIVSATQKIQADEA